MFGELRDSITNECFASLAKAVDILPFHWVRVWVISRAADKTMKKWNYEKTVPVTRENEAWQFQEGEGEGAIKRVFTVKMYVMLPEELKKDPAAMPRILSFRSSSLRNGRKLMTMMTQGMQAGRGPAAFIYKLAVLRQENEQGIFGVLDVEKGAEAPMELQDAAFGWYEKINKGAVKEQPEDAGDDEPIETTGGPAPQAATPSDPGRF